MKKWQNEVRAKSWSHLCEEMYQGAWKSELQRFRSDYAYRGLSDSSYDLFNSFRRNCGQRKDLEYHILRNFRKYARPTAPGLTKTSWRLLVLAQHHGLPTRLLDWTYSPFIALHFATSNTMKYDTDGVVWKVDFVKVNHRAPSRLKELLLKERCNAFTVEMLEESIPDLHGFDHVGEQTFPVFFEPPSIDERIVNQYALFSVMSDPLIDFGDWLCDHTALYRRVIIPKDLKWEIRDKLDQANITERVLFPGLDGLAAWLARQYQPIV